MGSSRVGETMPAVVVSLNLGLGNRGKPVTDVESGIITHLPQLAAAAPDFNVRQHCRLTHTASAVVAVSVRLNLARRA